MSDRGFVSASALAENEPVPAKPQGVTVVIPCHNYARYLRAAIDSALAQTHAPVEVLVVDDGSTDESPEIIRSYGRMIRSIRQPNAGLSAARNTGIANATHDIVAFLDADDVLTPGFIARCLARAEELGPEFALIACGDQAIDAHGRPLPPIRSHGYQVDREVTGRDLALMSRFSPTVLVRKEAFERCGGFDTSLRSSEDRDMWIRIAQQFRVFRINDSLVQKRAHGSNMSRHSARQSATKRRVIAKAWGAGVAPKWNLWYWSGVWAVYLFQSGLMYHDERRAAVALAKYFASICVRPWFADPRSFEHPPLFRARAVLRTILNRH